jgi:hypothetical protein
MPDFKQLIFAALISADHKSPFRLHEASRSRGQLIITASRDDRLPLRCQHYDGMMRAIHDARFAARAHAGADTLMLRWRVSDAGAACRYYEFVISSCGEGLRAITASARRCHTPPPPAGPARRHHVRNAPQPGHHRPQQRHASRRTVRTMAGVRLSLQSPG